MPKFPAFEISTFCIKYDAFLDLQYGLMEKYAGVVLWIVSRVYYIDKAYLFWMNGSELYLIFVFPEAKSNSNLLMVRSTGETDRRSEANAQRIKANYPLTRYRLGGMTAL